MENYQNEISKLIVGKMPDFSRPVIFLDFDGVISPIHVEDFPDDKRNIISNYDNNVAKELHKGFEIFWFSELADFLRDKNCVWISSWKNETQTYLNPLLGFDFGYIVSPSVYDKRFENCDISGKLQGMYQIIEASGCDWVLLDDEAEFDGDVLVDLGIKSGLVVCPYPFGCLTVENCEEIENYINNCY